MIKESTGLHLVERSHVLDEFKESSGPIKYKEIVAENIVDAHRQLGEYMKDDIHEILIRKLEEISTEELAEKIRFVRFCKDKMLFKLSDINLNPWVRDALREYFYSIKSWAEGARLDEFAHVNAPKGISGEDLAWLLQNDNMGCETAMVFDKDGIGVLHKEEDDENRMKTAGVVTMKIVQGNEEMSFLTYPDLLPGSSAAWKKDFAQFVDFLYLKDKKNAGSLANVAAWVAFRLGNKVGPEVVIKSLMPYVDGYAFNFLRVVEDQVIGEKIEVAGDRIYRESLPQLYGSMLYQNNIISPDNAELKQYQDKPEDQAEFEKRRVRAERIRNLLIKFNLRNTKPEFDFEKLLRVFSFLGGGDYALRSPWTKMHIGVKMTNRGLTAYVGSSAGQKKELIEPVAQRKQIHNQAGKIVFMSPMEQV